MDLFDGSCRVHTASTPFNVSVGSGNTKRITAAVFGNDNCSSATAGHRLPARTVGTNMMVNSCGRRLWTSKKAIGS